MISKTTRLWSSRCRESCLITERKTQWMRGRKKRLLYKYPECGLSLPSLSVRWISTKSQNKDFISNNNGNQIYTRKLKIEYNTFLLDDREATEIKHFSNWLPIHSYILRLFNWQRTLRARGYKYFPFRLIEIFKNFQQLASFCGPKMRTQDILGISSFLLIFLLFLFFTKVDAWNHKHSVQHCCSI